VQFPNRACLGKTCGLVKINKFTREQRPEIAKKTVKRKMVPFWPCRWRMGDRRSAPTEESFSQCRDQARRVYYGAVFKAEKEIPVRRQFSHLCPPILLLLVALGAVSFAMAQNGPDNMVSLAIKAIDGNTIQLGSDYGKTYTFTLDAKTVYCQGVNKASDWTYLKEKIGEEATVTVKLAKDHKRVLVVWDQAPSIVFSLGSPTSGSESYGFPDMCRPPSYWTDAATKLMWTKQDNGSDVDWHHAKAYCTSLRLGGYSNWRLPTIEELQAIYAPERIVNEQHIKGNIWLYSESVWSSSTGDDPEMLCFDFHTGEVISAQRAGPHNGRALCVRRPP